MRYPDSLLRPPLPLGPYPVSAPALRAISAEAVRHGFALAHRLGSSECTDAQGSEHQLDERSWEISQIIESLRFLARERLLGRRLEVVSLVEELVADAVLTGAAMYEPQSERRAGGADAQVYLPDDPAWMSGVIASLIRDVADDLAALGCPLPGVMQPSLSIAPGTQEAG